MIKSDYQNMRLPLPVRIANHFPDGLGVMAFGARKVTALLFLMRNWIHIKTS